ncbi:MULTISPECIES: hypothetical protein [Bradyrhizobium]|uniref:hypothetical protein n=1 Tax=Bradyrhizobium TaxID=374 RepID=UPI0012EBC687|nr:MULTISPECIES: hypothetical protein [Bradyrhizobium]UFW46413.1 hypothetical protein BaraCB756_29440 [Bradyrhizobium arachidis]
MIINVKAFGIELPTFARRRDDRIRLTLQHVRNWPWAAFSLLRKNVGYPAASGPWIDNAKTALSVKNGPQDY